MLKLIKGLEYTQGKTSIAVKVADGDKTRSVNLTELVKNNQMLDFAAAIDMSLLKGKELPSTPAHAIADAIEVQQCLMHSADATVRRFTEELVYPFPYEIEDRCDDTKKLLKDAGFAFSGTVGAEKKLVNAIYSAFHDKSINFEKLTLKDKSKKVTMAVLNKPVVDKLNALLIEGITKAGVVVMKPGIAKALEQSRKPAVAPVPDAKPTVVPVASKTAVAPAPEPVQEKPAVKAGEDIKPEGVKQREAQRQSAREAKRLEREERERMNAIQKEMDASVDVPEMDVVDESAPLSPADVAKKIMAQKEAAKPYQGTDAVPYVANFVSDADTRRHLMSFLSQVKVDEMEDKSVLNTASRMAENNVFLADNPASVTFSGKQKAQEETITQINDMVVDIYYDMLVEDVSLTSTQVASRMMKAMAESGVQCVIMHSPDLANTNQPLSLREPDVKVSAEVIQKQDKTATPERVVMQGVRY